MKREHRVIMDIAVDKSGLDEEQILSKSKKWEILAVRAIVAKIMYEETSATLKEVGKSLGRDHTHVLVARRIANKFIKKNTHNARQLYDNIMTALSLHNTKNKLIVYYPDDYNIHRIITHINKLGDKNIKYQLT